MIDYWLSKLFYDLSADPALATQYRADRRTVLERYPLAPQVRAAVLADDVASLALRTNPYLLRYYFSITGMPDRDFIRGLNTPPAAATEPRGEPAHG
jgi:hypothetical protein